MPSSPVTSRIRVRRISFDFPTVTRNRHYVENDLLMSHLVSMLSAVFPEGEDFFVRSVEHVKDEITDPQLKRDVAASSARRSPTAANIAT